MSERVGANQNKFHNLSTNYSPFTQEYLSVNSCTFLFVDYGAEVISLYSGSLDK